MATTVQFVHDTISGGSTVSTATTTQKNVGLNTGGTAIVDRCRVFGGSGPADAPSETVAIDIGLNATGTVITNSAVHGGTARAGGGPATSTIGISLEGGTNHTIRWNSIYAGQPGTSAGANIGFVIAPGTKGVTIDDNLIFGDVRTNGFWLYECGTTLTSIQNNAFFSMPVALRRVTAGSTACDTLNDVAAVSDMVTTLAADFPALGLAGNFAVGVAACASPGPSCIGAVLAGWDAPTFGTQRFQSDGFALSPSVPCAIAKSVAAGPATTDLAGTARSAPFSLGANEAEACSP
jgi:hypothetical protein